MTRDSFLEVEGVAKSFGQERAVDGASLAVPEAGTLVLLGPSGCGKTTLLRMIAGLEVPDAGAVRLGGLVLAEGETFIPPEQRQVGMVFQESALFPHLSVARNVGFGLSRDEIASGRIEEALDLVGLAGFGDRSPGTLSGGQAQRVALARALAPRPKLMLFDEPFSSLDVGLKVGLRAEIAGLLRGMGMTSVFVTHDQADAFVLGDLVAVMREGRIVQVGSPADIYTCPVDPWVATFVGEANIVRGTADRRVVATPLGPISLSNGVSGDCDVIVRPEHIAMRSGSDGVVVDVDFFGHDSSYTVAVSGAKYTVRAVAAPLYQPGDLVSVAYNGPEAIAFPAKASSGITD